MVENGGVHQGQGGRGACRNVHVEEMDNGAPRLRKTSLGQPCEAAESGRCQIGAVDASLKSQTPRQCQGPHTLNRVKGGAPRHRRC